MEKNYSIYFDKNDRIKGIIVTAGEKEYIREINSEADVEEYQKDLNRFIIEEVWVLSTLEEKLEYVGKKLGTDEENSKNLKEISLDEKIAFCKSKSQFWEKYINQDYEIISKRDFNYASKEERKSVKEKTTAKEFLKKHIVPIAIIAVLTPVTLGFTACKYKNKQNTGYGTVQEEDALKGKTVAELIKMLETEQRKSAFNKITTTQDYFNNTAAPTIQKSKDGDKQLYVTADETTAAYIYANIKTMGTDAMVNIFGKSEIMCINPETGQYQMLDKDTISGKYLVFCMNVSYYFQRGATENSGVHQIFENETEGQKYKEFEDLVIKYNKNKTKENAAEIRAMLEEIYMSGQIDNFMTMYPGASSIIGTAIVPYLYLEGIIDKDTYKSIVEINEKVTCQDIYSQIGEMKLKENGQENIIERIIELQNEKLRGMDRNISMEDTLKGYSKSDLDNAIVNGAGFSNNKTVNRTVTNSREGAKNAGATDEQLDKAEKEADKKLEDKNQQEDIKWENYKEADTKGYDAAWAELEKGGDGYVTTPAGVSSEWAKHYQNGAAAARADWAQAEKDKDKWKEEHKDETTEETYVPENPTKPTTPTSPTTPTEKEEPTSPTVVTTPKDEIVSEEFIYHTESTKSSAPTESTRQKVQSVESYEPTTENTMDTSSKSSYVRVRA